jgi:hypothetical protein
MTPFTILCDCGSLLTPTYLTTRKHLARPLTLRVPPPSAILPQNMSHWKATKVDKGVQCYLGSGTTSPLPSARGDGVIPFPPR